MNILMLVADFPPMIRGGVANYSYNIAKYLSTDNNVKVYMFPRGSPITKYFANIRFIIDIGRKLREKRSRKEVDIVYAVSFQPQFGIIGFFAKLLGLPFVSHGVGLDVFLIHPLYVFGRRTSCLFSTKIICGTRFQKRTIIEEGVSKEKISVVLGGVDCKVFKPLTQRDEFRKALGVEDKFVLLSLGRLSRKKGFYDSIKALSYLKDIDDIVLLVVGDGPERYNLDENAKNLSVKNKVKFLGFVSSDYLPKVYNAADLFIAPFESRGRYMEGFPLVVQEAMACGVPVITTITSGLPELVENNTGGFLVPENSPQNIAEKIRELYENDKLRKKMAQNARKRAETLLDYEVAVDKITKILREACVSR